jgi:hypothetical protein
MKILSVRLQFLRGHDFSTASFSGARMDNGMYRSTVSSISKGNLSGSCVPTNSRASATRFRISRCCYFRQILNTPFDLRKELLDAHDSGPVVYHTREMFAISRDGLSHATAVFLRRDRSICSSLVYASFCFPLCLFCLFHHKFNRTLEKSDRVENFHNMSEQVIFKPGQYQMETGGRRKVNLEALNFPRRPLSENLIHLLAHFLTARWL